MTRCLHIALLLCLLATGLCAAVVAEDRVVTEGNLRVSVIGCSDETWVNVSGEIRQQLQLAETPQADPPLADDLAFFSQQQLTRLGFPDAAVDWKVTAGGIVLTVREGLRVFVGDVTFDGLTAAPAEEMREYLLRATLERMTFFKKADVPFVTAEIEDGTTLVQRRLQSLGYLEATVSPPSYSPGATEHLRNVRVGIVEGPKSVFGQTSWPAGVADLPEIREEVGWPAAGTPYNEVELENARKRVLGALQERGHFGALVTVDASVPAHGGEVPVAVGMVPGPVFKVAGVTADGDLSRGAQRTIRATYRPSLGERYSPRSLEAIHRRALDSEIYSRLEVDPVAIGPDEVELRVTGEEAKPKTLGFYGGYETFKGPILGLEWRHANFADSGRGLAIKAEGNGRGFDGSLKWREPAFFATRLTWEPEISAKNLSIFDYDRRSYALRSPFTLPVGRHMLFGATLGVSDDRTESDVLTRPELGPTTYSYATAGLSALFDWRDSATLPTKGWMASYNVEAATDVRGKAGDWLRQELTVAGYWPLSDKWRVAGVVRMGRIEVDGGVTELPIDLRLFNGGASSVRSFDERELGPKSKSSTPLGGLSTQSASVELSYEAVSNLELALFGDAGALSAENERYFSTDADWRYAIGLGVRYRLPVGPLRLDYGFNPDPKAGESRGAFHLTFGFAF